MLFNVTAPRVDPGSRLGPLPSLPAVSGSVGDRATATKREQQFIIIPTPQQITLLLNCVYFVPPPTFPYILHFQTYLLCYMTCAVFFHRRTHTRPHTHTRTDVYEICVRVCVCAPTIPIINIPLPCSFANIKTYLYYLEKREQKLIFIYSSGTSGKDDVAFKNHKAIYKIPSLDTNGSWRAFHR